MSINDLKAFGEKHKSKYNEYLEKIKNKLDSVLEHQDWQADDIIDLHPDHDYPLSPVLDCIIYYVTGFSFFFNIWTLCQ